MQSIRCIIFGLIFFTTHVFANSKILICTDTNFWYPYTFTKNQEAMGLHVDIIGKALRNLGFEPDFQPASFGQCLSSAKQGKVDAVATASYKTDRAIYLNYPANADDKKSPLRVTQVAYVVITPAKNQKGENTLYKFSGDIKSIPQPIRIPAHYSIAEDFKKAGVKVKEGTNSLENFKQLAKEGVGSVIDVEEVATHLATQPEFAEKFIIQKTPLNLKSYYLAFSRKGSVSNSDAEKIWQEIAKVRNNPTLMAEFLKKY